MNVNKWHSTAVHHTYISLAQKTYFSFYGYLILKLKVQFIYDTSHHTSDISIMKFLYIGKYRHTDCEIQSYHNARSKLFEPV
jgi:hypothetical protein